jgi:hypothetical protein
MINIRDQYVYCMSNPSFPPDKLKIGRTKRHPIIRAKELHTGTPTPFEIEFVIITSDSIKLEKTIHDYIKEYRDSDREFFKISKDVLIEILTKELNLNLTPINEINLHTTNKIKTISEITLEFKELEQEANEFFSKLNKDKTELVIKNTDNKKNVSIRTTEISTQCLYIHGFEDDDEIHIKNTIQTINNDILQYKKWLDDYDEEKIIKKIGVVTLKNDNKLFGEMILDTHKKLHDLKNKYTWEL